MRHGRPGHGLGVATTHSRPELERDESLIERLDRNWGELLQELRVVQTGVQLLTGFLLTLPFQQRFKELTAGQQHLYLVIVGLSATATALLIAPVTMHRILFRQHAREALVRAGHLCALLGSIVLGLALSGVTLLIFDVVQGVRSGLTAGGLSVAALVLLWVALPLVIRFRTPPP
ncbi:MAG: hypothetical protein JWN31_1016 [Frankiales bacterium]|nr:hypothetical protein [Frankiales bacterium]